MSPIKGAKLCCYFAYKPNKLEYCGTNLANKRIYKCLTQNNCSNLESSFKSFKALYPYLRTISNNTGKQLLAKQSVESYWIGSNLLNKFTYDDFYFFLTELSKQGVPDFFIEELKEKIISNKIKFIPHHSFNVIFLGVGNVTGSVQYNIANINNCLIRSGKIVAINKELIQVDTTKLIIDKSSQLKIVNTIEEVNNDNKINKGIRIGDTVAIHWKDLVKEITTKQSQELTKWNNIMIENYNNSKITLQLK